MDRKEVESIVNDRLYGRQIERVSIYPKCVVVDILGELRLNVGVEEDGTFFVQLVDHREGGIPADWKEGDRYGG